MRKTKSSKWQGCPTRYAAGIFGDKWCFVLLRDVLLVGKRFYGEFLTSQEGISTNILANRLIRLEKNGMFTRHPDLNKKSRVYYLPTEKAKALIPTLLAMMVWAAKYDGETEAPAHFTKTYAADPAGMANWYLEKIDRVNARL